MTVLELRKILGRYEDGLEVRLADWCEDYMTPCSFTAVQIIAVGGFVCLGAGFWERTLAETGEVTCPS